jgi:hypothetical protein
MRLQMQDKAYLFGPFFGELSWEYFRFAPYAIYLKKISPDIKMIVLTRPSRFDLYGQYADILIPQRLEKEETYNQSAFKLINYGDVLYETLARKYKMMYEKRYDILDHHYPDIGGWRYKVKWQFPRDRMDYNFIARKKNKEVVDSIIGDDKIILSSREYEYSSDNYKILHLNDFKKEIEDKVDDKSITYIGCLIELIKKSTVVVSTLNQDLGHLAILLRKPLIYLNRRMKIDEVKLMNTLNTPIIDCKAVSEGVEIYENM